MMYNSPAFFNFSARRSFVYIAFTLLFSLFITYGWAQSNNTTSVSSKSSLRVLAYQYLQANKMDEAEAAFLKAIKVSPKEIANYSDLSLLYFKERNYKDAEMQAKSALKLNKNTSLIRSILAKIYIQKGDKTAAANELKTILNKEPKNIYANYALINLNEAPSANGMIKGLLKLISFAPDNIALRLQLTELFVQNSKADSAMFFLQSVKKIAPDFSSSASDYYNQSAAAIRAGKFGIALNDVKQFHELMKATVIYARGALDLQSPTLPEGYTDFTTSQIVNKNNSNKKPTLSDIHFTDISKNMGLDFLKSGKAKNAVIAVTDYNNAGQMYLYTSNIVTDTQDAHLLTGEVGAFREANVTDGIKHDGEDLDAAFADYDNDGYPDLFIATTNGLLLYKNNGDGSFTRAKEDIGLKNTSNIRKLLIADFDQDGDLDLYVAQSHGNRFFRNNGDGTFKDQTTYMGLKGNISGTVNMDYADWDSDGDLDIVTVNRQSGVDLLSNMRHSKFQNITNSAILKNLLLKGSAAAFADYNNDGLQDLFVAGVKNGKSYLLKNLAGKKYVIDPASKSISNALDTIDVHDVAFFDFDNDGYQDFLVAGSGKTTSSRGVQLFHNNAGKSFSNVSYLLPPTVQSAYHIAIADFNSDGDDDLFLAGPTGAQLLRNDGGNLNHYLQIQLTGLAYGNNKNNRLGIGARVELKAEDLYQVRTVKRGLINLGIGMRNRLDAVRVIWPNGTPQTIVNPSHNERIIEKELLKGSCPFLFTWNGQKYEFIKDMLWRSALGMPLAIKGKDTLYSFSDASKEYLLVPGEKLKPKNGKYSIKITEELWEAVYFDKAGLVAVDHPDSIDVYADERFVLPPFPGKTVHKVSTKHLPVSAKDDKGNDLLPKLSRYDFQYASSFSLGKYQGLAEDHDLILDLGNKAVSDSLYLYLRGWIFPTDASINTAMTQTDKYKTHMPSLQVINAKGQWQTVIPNLGFPMGRDKMVIANLSGKFLTKNDRRVRISTNMQIYWDHVFFSTENVKSPVKMTDLKMTTASLNYRGYSASYRKGGPYGPEWFDYDHTTKGQKWRDLTGNYTRYGDVFPLLQNGDDKYIICDGGDEISIDFDARNLPAVPKGWKRDFLIYSEGWVKDGDLNTANGQTVAPLPFHAMPTYPYSSKYAYPTDAEHRAYQQQYNTRKVSTADFRNALRTSKPATDKGTR